MSSSPTMEMSDETSNEYTSPSGAESSVLPDEEDTSEMSEDCSDPEPEGLTFYHMDLYDARDRLEIFPDKQFVMGGRDEDVAEISESEAAGEKWAPSAEQIEQDLRKEVEELARLYGLDEDRDTEEHFLEYHAPTTRNVPMEQMPHPKKDVEAEEPMHQTEEQDKEEAEFSEEQDKEEAGFAEEQGKEGGEFAEEQGKEEGEFAGEQDKEEGEFSERKDKEKGEFAEEHSKEKGEFAEEQDKEGEVAEEQTKQDGEFVEEQVKEKGEYADEQNKVEGEFADKQEKEKGEFVDEQDKEEGEVTEEQATQEGTFVEEQGKGKGEFAEEQNKVVGELAEEQDKEEGKSNEQGCEGGNEELPNEGIGNDVDMNEHIDEERASYVADSQEDQQAIDDQNLEDSEDLQPKEEEKSIAENEIPDIFCVTCKAPIRAFEKLFGIHKEHQVTQLANAVEDVKDEIHKNMCTLEEQIAQMENFASHLEEIFITVEENFGRQEQSFETHYTEIMQTLAQRYDEKAQELEEEKKQKLEALYGQLVDCGKNLDTSKDLMETIQELFKSKDKVAFVKTAVDTIDRLEEFLKADVNFQSVTYPDYKNKTIDFSEVQQLLDSINTVPAPSAPVINPQTPNSATGTSVKVCWSIFSDDTVESYQLYYKPVSDETPSEEQAEFVVNLKETYCTVENLVPNTQYEFWVTALNTTGIGPASERAVYVTAPSPPVIKYKQCRSCENAALICWESGENLNPVDSYTVELCKVTNEESGNYIAESIVGIPTCESLIQLQPRETYDIYVRAANVGGASERSKPASVRTTGTFFHLNDSTAHPLLSILDDGFTITCDEEESLGDLPYHYNSFTRCIAVMGNLIPVKGKHYWEVQVEESTEYRIGVAFEDTNRNGYIGANNTSWCMRHVITPSRHKYEFLHCGTTPDVRITIPPQRIGILLDYDNGKLSFFNMDLFQHLYTFDCHFQHLVHPCFALEKPGGLRIRNGIAIPQCVILS